MTEKTRAEALRETQERTQHIIKLCEDGHYSQPRAGSLRSCDCRFCLIRTNALTLGNLMVQTP